MAQASFSFGASSPASVAFAACAPLREPHFDELRDGGALRAPWQGFFEELGTDDLSDLDRRLAALRRQIREDGITYNVYADVPGEVPARPWSLDLLPFIIEPSDWACIERGVTQRAALTAAIMRDAYGPRRLLREGLLPAALVLGHPGYLRPLAALAEDPPANAAEAFAPPAEPLQIIAFDLARAADGQWWVVSQRTQAPSGLGYALQNRLIVSRQFPEAFRALSIQRLAASFRRLLDTLTRHAAASAGGSPRIVLLTPGPFNETYFEHAYLARYLGLPLVEGGDLTVRDDRVFLKTVRGLERVHAILRRVDDDFCDPLELRPDSALGVPGLLQAVRAGQVLVANALGSGFLESPALQGFLPALSERLLGESLALPSLATWWCGERAAFDAVRGQLASKVIKPTYPASARRPHADALIGADLDAEALQALIARIEVDPASYTVQDYLPLSQARVWQDGRLLPRAAMVRVFALLDSEGRWHALPGGLTRIAGRAQRVVSMQSGGSSLDTWVQTDGQVDRDSLLPDPLRPEALARQRRPVSSRAAENLFWMGRYTERADHSARLALAALALLGGDDAPSVPVAAVLGRLCFEQGLVPPNVPPPGQGAAVFQRTLLAGLRDADGTPGVAFNLACLQRAAAQIRERLVPEHWQLLRVTAERFALDPESAGKGARSLAYAIDALKRLSIDLAAITGAHADRMTRDDGWRLLAIGRQLERLACLTGTLAAFEASGALRDDMGFDLLLTLADSGVTYRGLYQRRQELPPLLHLLVFDGDNPRSLASVVESLRAEIGRLPAGVGELLPLLPPPEHWPALAALCEGDTTGRLPALADTAASLRDNAFALSDAIGSRFFSHAAGLQALV